MKANPFRSEAQRRLFYALEARGKLPAGTAGRWQAQTHGALPERIGDAARIPPAAVRANLARGLALVRAGRGGAGLRPETVAWAERLATGAPADDAKLRAWGAWLARHGASPREAAARRRDPASPAAVAYLLWGATPGIPYSARRRDPVFAWLAGLAPRTTKRNDARQGAGAASPRVVQVDDEVEGSWGAIVGEALARVYRFDGGGWHEAAIGRWDPTRGRLVFSTPRAVPLAVAARLGADLLADGGAADLARYVAELPTHGFHGDSRDRAPDLAALPPEAERLVRAAARAQCGGARRPSKPTAPVDPASTDAYRKCRERCIVKAFRGAKTEGQQRAAEARCHATCLAQARARHAPRRGWAEPLTPERARAVYLAAARELCGEGEPISTGSACDLALGAIERAPRAPCDAKRIPCPRRLSEATLRSWAREHAMPENGPYETSVDHAMGEHPCCYYHPDTQARLALHARVARDLGPSASARDVERALQRAEAADPRAEVWKACDAAAHMEVQKFGLETGTGQGSGGTFALWRALYHALSKGEDEHARVLYDRINREGAMHGTFEDIRGLDAHFWDEAHREAHETGEPQNIAWAHKMMRAGNVPVKHPRGGGAVQVGGW